MTLDELTRPGSWIGLGATALVAFFGGGGIWKWLGARATAKPDVIEASGQIIQQAFVEMRAEIARQDEREKQLIADIKSARDDRHRLANRLTALEGYTSKLLDYARSLLTTVEGSGKPPPPPPGGLTIDELMAGPVPPYQPGLSTMPRPVSDKDNGR